MSIQQVSVTMDDIAQKIESTKITTDIDESSLSSVDVSNSSCSGNEFDYPSTFSDCTIEKFYNFREKIPYLKNNNKPVFFNCSSQIPTNHIVINSITNFFNQRAQSADAEFIVFDGIVNETRTLYAELLGLSSKDSNKIAFTRDSSESLHLIQDSFKFSKGDTILVVDSEFQHNNLSWLGYSINHPELELRVKFVDSGKNKSFVITPENIAPYIDSSVKIISLSMTSYQSGLCNDIKGITSKYPNIHTIVDFTQDVGFHGLDVNQLGCSAAFFSCFKGLFVPQGLGILYMSESFLKDTKPLPPFINIKGMEKFDVHELTVDSINTTEEYLLNNIHKSALKYEHSNLPNLQIIASNAMLKFLLHDISFPIIETYLTFLRSKIVSMLTRYGITVYNADKCLTSPNIVVTSINNPRWMKYFKDQNCTVSQFRGCTRFSIGIYNSVDDIEALEEILRSGLEEGFKFVV